jgi:hypothetical protein
MPVACPVIVRAWTAVRRLSSVMAADSAVEATGAKYRAAATSSVSNRPTALP